MASNPGNKVVPPWTETDFRIVIGRTRIEYDPSKEESNCKRHGYSLGSAVHFLERLILPVPAPLFMTTDPFREKEEIRHNHMTLDDDDGGHVVFFVTTMRPNEIVRVISLRRASDAERELYAAHAKAMGYELPPNY